jgi:hypothetical protein
MQLWKSNSGNLGPCCAPPLHHNAFLGINAMAALKREFRILHGINAGE